jgi:hypothetical protein
MWIRLTMKDLEHVRSALIEKLGDEGKLLVLNARLILRTGVSLTRIDPGQAKDPRSVTKVLAALRDMGFEIGK